MFFHISYVCGRLLHKLQKMNAHSLTMWQEYKWWMEEGIFNFLSQSWLLYPKFMRPIGPDGSVSAVTVTACTSIFQAIFNGTCQLVYLLVFPGIDMERQWGLLFSVFSPPLIILPREASEEGTVGPLVKGSMMGVGPSLELLVNHSISVTWTLELPVPFQLQPLLGEGTFLPVLTHVSGCTVELQTHSRQQQEEQTRINKSKRYSRLQNEEVTS